MRIWSVSLIWLAVTALSAAQSAKPELPKMVDFDRMLERFDKNKDGFLQRDELPEQLQKRFEELDTNKDSKLSKEEFPKAALPAAGPGPFNPAALLERFDKNKDGFIDRDEAPEPLKRRFAELDTNKDGKLSKEELQKARSDTPAGPKNDRKPGEFIAPAAKGERIPDKLKVGDVAPEFTLNDPEGKKQVSLSSFKNAKPVVLIFGSHT